MCRNWPTEQDLADLTIPKGLIGCPVGRGIPEFPLQRLVGRNGIGQQMLPELWIDHECAFVLASRAIYGG